MAKKHISKTRCSNTEEEEHYILSCIIYVATFSFNNICISSSKMVVVEKVFWQMEEVERLGV